MKSGQLARLLEMFPLFDQAQLKQIDVTNPAAVYTRSCSFLR